MYYLVKNQKWKHALIAIHSAPGISWECGNYGYICETIADQMVTAGIAKYDDQTKIGTTEVRE